jgi:uncharacterized membrane protein
LKSAYYINFFTSVVVFTIGLLILAGILYPQGDNSMITVFGVVLMVYGVYRFINTFSKIRLEKLQEKRSMMQKEKENFFKQK